MGSKLVSEIPQYHIINYTFTANQVLWCGGLFLGIIESAANNHVIINGSHFKENKVAYACHCEGGSINVGYGGGASLLFDSYLYGSESRSVIKVISQIKDVILVL